MKAPRTLIYSLVVAASAFAVGLSWPDLVGRAAYAVESGRASAARERLANPGDLSAAFRDVARAIKPSVVNIRSIRKVEVSNQLRRMPFPGNRFFLDPFGEDLFERFFGDRFNRRMPQAPQQEEFVQRGLGTGVIVSEDGYIITNNHVVADADDVTVTLFDDRTFDAEVIGTDEKTDLAVLKIEGDDLLAAKLGDSDEIQVGDWVVAMGNPFGLSQTLTVGVVSAKGRANVGIADYEDFIQTDAAINPGNSGGPLVTLNGEVVGINTAIATRSGGYQGIGFAIPSNMVRHVMDAIIEDGSVVRGWLGVTIQDLTDDLARSFGFDGTDGVLIGDVVDGGPADKAGLECGDIIIKYDGRSVDNMNEVRNRVAETKPGTKVDVEIFRDGDRKTIAVEIGELESQIRIAGDKGIADDLGLTLQDLTPDLARRLDLDPDHRGVVVTRVSAGSIAERAGLRQGDLIVAVGSSEIDDLTDFRSELSQRDLDDGVRLTVLTQGMQRFVFLKR